MSGDAGWVPGAVDPRAMRVEHLRTRARLLLELDRLADERGLPRLLTLVPVEACDFACWLCWRCFRRELTDAEAAAEFAQESPGEVMDELRMYCTDCHGIINAWHDAAEARKARRDEAQD